MLDKIIQDWNIKGCKKFSLWQGLNSFTTELLLDTSSKQWTKTGFVPIIDGALCPEIKKNVKIL